MARTLYGFSSGSTITANGSIFNSASGRAVLLGLSAPTANSASAVIYRNSSSGAGSEMGTMVVASPGTTFMFPFPFKSMNGIYVTVAGGSVIAWTE